MAADQEVGQRVAQNGLTAQPSRAADAGGAMDGIATSMANTKAERKQISATKKEAAKDAVIGGALAVRAVARGYAGDAAGAASDGVQAAGSVGQAAQKSQQAKQAQRRVDAPVPSAPRQAASSNSSQQHQLNQVQQQVQRQQMQLDRVQSQRQSPQPKPKPSAPVPKRVLPVEPPVPKP